MKRTGLVVVALVVGLSGCKKDSSKTSKSDVVSALPVEMTRKPAVVDTSKLAAPALFANVPADTPYLVGSFEAIPLDYWSKIANTVAPAVRKYVDKARADIRDSQDPDDRLGEAFLSELDGKWNAAGLESLGLSATPRFALYGIGLAPLVFRIEVKDEKAVLATVQRIATKAGKTLPAPEVRDGRNFWRWTKKDATFVIALVDNQFVFSVGPTKRMEDKLGLILGIEKPAQSMADGKAFARVMTDFGYGPYLVGYLDSKLAVHSLPEVTADEPKRPSEACIGELDKMAGRMPRLVFGYHELTTKKQTMSIVAELAPDLAKELGDLRTEVPGLGTALANQPLMAFGGGIDFVGGQKFLIGSMQSWQKVVLACKDADDNDISDDIAEVSKPLPPQLAQVKGGILTVQELVFNGRSPIPSKVEAFMLATATNAKGLWEQALQMQPKLAQLGITADGKLHDLPKDKMPLPFAVSAGVSDNGLAVGVGENGKALAEKMFGATGGGKVPFLAFTYDYGRILELAAQFSRMKGDDDPENELNLALAKLFSRGSMTIDTSDKGLVMWASIDMK